MFNVNVAGRVQVHNPSELTEKLPLVLFCEHIRLSPPASSSPSLRERSEMEPNQSSPNADPSVSPQPVNSVPNVAPDEILDWDFQLQVDASHRPSGTTQAKLRFLGRAVPLPYPAPSDQD